MVVKRSTTNMAVLIFLLISLASSHSRSTVTLELVNWIAYNVPAFITCSEKNKVLGDPVRVEHDGTYEYPCHTVMLGTSCRCEVKWDNQIRYFKAYKFTRDHSICGSKCRWYLVPGGPLLADSSEPIDYPVVKRIDNWSGVGVFSANNDEKVASQA
uniref:S-protein homolog n=1 Tax=Kalanchoe fedtschenkoi TaxID=63787 RepID=A0A7N0VI36_KALFE